MARKLYISGTSGTMMISNGEVNDEYVSQNPIPFRSLLYFHSGLPYIQIAQKINAGTLTFPARDRGLTTWPDGGKGCGGGCCFIMLEARYGTGIMDAVVRRYRDENMTEHNKRGYYKLAEVLVPLMREYSWIKGLIILTFANPLVYYAKWHYGQNKWGWIFAPIKNLWMKVFKVLGTETKFIRENGEVI
jgi:hypothetical protein